MRRFVFLAAIAFAATGLAQSVPELQPYPLPAKAEKALTGLAGTTDVLVLGELHGTQEVPAIASALLAPLSKLGYGVLALEMPADQQQPLVNWATGKTADIPPFFNKSIKLADGRLLEDGRGNVQLLSLVRTALSPPLQWKLVCFDEPWHDITYSPAAATKVVELPPPTKGLPDEMELAVWHEKSMASRLAHERDKLAPQAKILAICGNIHARTSNTCREGSPFGFPTGHPVMKIWPSFAAAVQMDQPTWQVRSIRIEPHSGSYFAAVSTDQDPTPRAGVHSIRSKKQVAEATAQPLIDEYWNWSLDLPTATAATFLVAHQPDQAEVENPALRDELLRRGREDQAIRKELIAAGADKPNDEIGARMKQIDGGNQERMKAIVQEHGWPTAALVGKDAVHEAFLLVQHASDTAFQKQMLPLIEQSYRSGDLEGQSYALLVDRIRVRERQPQLYGTQARPIDEWKDKEPSLLPIEDEANVEKRRAEVGLPPLTLYLKVMKQVYFPESTQR